MIQRMKNRHLVITLDDNTTIDLRPPNVTEWAQIVEAFEMADLAVRLGAQQVDEAYTVGKTTEAAAMEMVMRATWGTKDEDAPYAQALAETIALLSRTRIDAGQLPMWASQNTFGVLFGHWRRVEVTLEGADPLPTPAPATVPWTDNVDPDEPPTVDLDALAAVDAPSAESAVGGLAAGKPTAAAL